MHGNDRRSRPAQIKVGPHSYRLAPLKQADSQVVGRLPVPTERIDEAVRVHPVLAEIGKEHGSVTALHATALESVRLAGDRPLLLTQMLAQAGEVGGALMEQLDMQGLVRRKVTNDGQIVAHVPWRPWHGRVWRSRRVTA